MSELLDWGNAAVRLRLALRDGSAVIVGLDRAEAEPVPSGIALPPAELLVAGGVLPGSQRHVELGTTNELRYASHAESTAEGQRSLRLVHRRLRRPPRPRRPAAT